MKNMIQRIETWITLYLLIPFLIFLAGWTKWYVAVIAGFIVIFCTYRVLCQKQFDFVIQITRKEWIKVFFVLTVLAILVVLSGIGGILWQNADHSDRNTLFRILVEYHWPVIQKQEGKSGIAIIYYIAFWLPSAAVGKVFGLQAGFIFQAVWAFLGLTIVYYLLCYYCKKIVIWPVFVFFFFSGMDIVGYLFHNYQVFSGLPLEFKLTTHLEWWAGNYQYSSIITQLFWVFNQSIPAWIITLLLVMQKNLKNSVFYLVLSLLYSTLPFLGLSLIFVVTLIQKLYLNRKSVFGELCTISNLLGGSVIGIISFLYLWGNNASQGVDLSLFYKKDYLIKVEFLFCEFVILALAIVKFQWKNIKFYLAIIPLFFLAFIRVGYGGDFGMRVSVPFLVLLILLIIDSLRKCKEQKKYVSMAFIIGILLLGSYTPFTEIARTIDMSVMQWKQMGQIERKEVREDEIFGWMYFTGSSDNFFFRYIGK